MRLFILFILFLLTYSTSSLAQSATEFDNLPSEQKRIIKKKLKAMSVANKIQSFTVFEEKYANSLNKITSGTMLSLEASNDPKANSLSSESLKITNLHLVNSYLNIPFPSVDTRNTTKEPLPSWLPTIFQSDYLVDLDTTFSQILFYGLDSTGIYLNTTPYLTWDSLFSATLKHDLIYTPASLELWQKELNNLHLKSRQEKSLDEKLKVKYFQELNKSNKVKLTPTEKEVMQWIRDSYTNSIDLSTTSELPIKSLEHINLCSFSFKPEYFAKFSRQLNNYTFVPSYSPGLSYKKDMNRLAAYDLVIIPATSLSEIEFEFVQELAKETSVLIVGFGSDSINFMDEENVKFLSVPEDNRLSQSIAAQTIFNTSGKLYCSERLHYGIPELVGMNSSILKLIDNVVKEAINEEAIPGCQILVAKDGTIVFNKAYGYQTYDSTYKINDRTKYDLASITKVLATTQGIMYLLEKDSIGLDEPLSKHLKYLDDTNKKDITIRQIMAHQAGLYPYYPFWKKAKEKLKLEDQPSKDVQVGKSIWVNSAVEDSLLYWAATSDLLADRIDTITHDQYYYSDIGFFLLKDLIEKQTEMSLDEFLNEQLYKPIGTSLVFNPTCLYPLTDLAPTEEDNLLRHEIVQGFVHDRNAALMGGVSGQAGLFGNANDVAIMLQLQLNGGCYGDRRYFEESTIKQFISRQYDNNRRGLGWDMPGTEPDGPVSELASEETFGHTGFTGGSIWADPKESLIFVFLSNRVYPSVENTKLIDMNIRTRIQDIVYRSILK